MIKHLSFSKEQIFSYKNWSEVYIKFEKGWWSALDAFLALSKMLKNRFVDLNVLIWLSSRSNAVRVEALCLIDNGNTASVNC